MSDAYSSSIGDLHLFVFFCFCCCCCVCFFVLDMAEIEKAVRSVVADGLLWGACELISRIIFPLL